MSKVSASRFPVFGSVSGHPYLNRSDKLRPATFGDVPKVP
ncbi:uncharacterized protein CCOS01_15677 [Colletotrichum costaricense]|uniref:Uncharacterized protein n=1 Tax=Colletotrichum costaricense TaxID=1209916 RepID=A0AAJ0DT35_9PEZI|nr:uncharacterized protein CCOS01_15677 [Colletotrichum costaricense]KAK1509161.1 hypothetical protein CCOS01_15677 [Colletotrichum costaricense]